jgi:hypothetical protein
MLRAAAVAECDPASEPRLLSMAAGMSTLPATVTPTATAPVEGWVLPLYCPPPVAAAGVAAVDAIVVMTTAALRPRLCLQWWQLMMHVRWESWTKMPASNSHHIGACNQ